MFLSMFLKRRKADLLQNIWEQSSLQSQEENNSDKIPQGLQSLILDQNPKFGDTGVRQLMYALKSDVWLRSLSLKYCGLTKQGAEIMIRLLQSNSVIVKLDLTRNRIPINTLQMILRLLKRRKEMVDSMTLKKLRRDWRRKALSNRIHGTARRDRKHFKNRTERLRWQKHQWKKLQKFEKRIKQVEEIRGVKDKDYCRRKKLCDLEAQLVTLIESNSKLKCELSSNKALLDAEAQQRSKMEDELLRVSLRLNNLKTKAVMLDCVSSKACSESQLLIGLKSIFEKLESLAIVNQQDENREMMMQNAGEPLWSSPLAQQKRGSFVNCLQRRPYCPPMKI